MIPVSIVVPCYNEESRLDRVAFRAFLEAGGGPALLFVDDGSTDGTLAVLQALAAGNPARASVHALERNRGKAEAVRQGMRRALEGGAGYIGFWDADLATPLDQITEFVTLLERAPDIDLVMGARVRMLGRRIERFGLRHLIGRAFATFASFVLALPVYDTQCGAKIFRRSVALERALASPFRSRWSFDVELLQRLQAAWGERGVDRIVEYPLQEWHDYGGSKVSFAQGAMAFLTLIGLAVRSPTELPAADQLGGSEVEESEPPPSPLLT